MKPLIVDAHQDLAYNMLAYSRDYSLPLDAIRAKDRESNTVAENGTTLLSWYEYQKANVAIIFGTLFAAPASNPLTSVDGFHYQNSEEAHTLYLNQINRYEQLFEDHPDQFSRLRSKTDLEKVLASKEAGNSEIPTSIMILMEGGDGIRNMEELSFWWEKGVRIIGPAWKATKFCGGTGQPGPLTDQGHELLWEMAKYGYILDISHMDWLAAEQSLDEYSGTIIASHANALSKVIGGTRNRFLTDEIIKKLIERNGVIGVIPYNNFLMQGWEGMDPRPNISVDLVVDHIDAICQMAGNANHVGFGTDFDGGFGVENTPDEIDSISDLHIFTSKLASRGYSETDIENIFGGNWISILKRSLM
jgi:membrane dipeptidase